MRESALDDAGIDGCGFLDRGERGFEGEGVGV